MTLSSSRMKAGVLSLMLAAAAVGLAHNEHSGLRHWEVASSDPDRVFLSFHGNPATTRAVSWRTDTSIDEAEVQIARSTDGPQFSKETATISAQTETVDLNRFSGNKQGEVKFHSAVMDKLEPDTLYAYRVGNGGRRWSEWMQFRTAKQGYAPFQFVYFGDAQNSILSHWSRVIRMANQTAPRAAFAVHAGDLVNEGHKDREWAEWFKAGGWLHAQWTGIPVLGNHEFRSYVKKGERSVALHWRPQFALPVEKDLPEELHETVYTVDYQQVRVIVLNSIIKPEAQTAWLEKKLKDDKSKWKIVTCHYSVFSPAKDRDFTYARENWKPLFDKYGVDLVLQGHDHTYVRGQIPVRRSDGGKDGQIGTTYITSVSGPKTYPFSDEQLKKYAADGYVPVSKTNGKQFFHVIGFNGNHLTYTAYTADGKLFDSAVITKDFATGIKTVE